MFSLEKERTKRELSLRKEEKKKRVFLGKKGMKEFPLSNKGTKREFLENEIELSLRRRGAKRVFPLKKRVKKYFVIC